MKKVEKKLVLKTQLVSALNQNELNAVQGGLIIVEISVDGCGADEPYEEPCSGWGCYYPQN